MQFRGHIVWNTGVIAASVLIAVVAATAALWILFRVLALFPHLEILRITSAVIMALAVNGNAALALFANFLQACITLEWQQRASSTTSPKATRTNSAYRATMPFLEPSLECPCCCARFS